MQGYYASPDSRTFRFADGDYFTEGPNGQSGAVANTNWALVSNWRFIGESEEGTVIHRSGYHRLEGEDWAKAVVLGIYDLSSQTGIEVCRLTVDCDWTDAMTVTTASFVQPALDANVTVSVTSNTVFDVGESAYIQQPSGLIIGQYEVVSVGTGTVTLKATAIGDLSNGAATIGVGVACAAGAYAGPAINTQGVVIGAQHGLVEEVTVRNSGCPFYERALGIQAVGYDTDPPSVRMGLRIKNCTVEDAWGGSGMLININSNNESADAGNFASVRVEGCTLTGKGVGHQGLGFWGLGPAVFTNNTISQVHSGIFNDVGYNTAVQILTNTIQNAHYGILAGGGYVNQHVGLRAIGNTIQIKQGGQAFHLQGEIHDSFFEDNASTLYAGATSASEGSVSATNSEGNTWTGNTRGAGVTAATIPAEFLA